MLRLKGLHLEDFLSHRDTSLEFPVAFKKLIDGKSGAGKTAIIEAVCWALYGRGRQDNRHMVRAGKKRAKVTLTLADDEHEYAVERSVTSSGKQSLSVYMDGAEVPLTTLKDKQEYVTGKLVRMSWDLFVNSVCYTQGGGRSFASMSAAERKEMLLELAGADDLDGLLRTAKEMIGEVSREAEIENRTLEMYSGMLSVEKAEKALQYRQEERDGLEKTLALLEDKVKDMEGQLKGMPDAVKAEADLKAKLASERETASVIREELEKAKGAMTVDVDAIKKELEDNRNVVKGLEEADRNLEQLRQSLDKWRADYFDLMGRKPVAREDYDAKIQGIFDAIADIRNEKVPVCHKCNEPYRDARSRQEERILKLTQSLSVVREDKARYECALDKWTKEVAELGECPDDTPIRTKQKGIRDSIRGLNSLIASQELQISKASGMSPVRIEDLEGRLAEKEKSAKALESALAEASGKVRDLEGKEAVKDRMYEEKLTARSELATCRAYLSIAENNLEKARESEGRIREAKERLDGHLNDLKCLNTLKEALSPTGVKAMMVDYVLPRFEAKINESLALMSDFRVKVDTQRDGVDRTKEGLFITVMNSEGVEYDYDGYSGGEKLKINVSIAEAMAQESRLAFRMIDELFVGLDSDTGEKFTDVLMSIHSRYPQSLCISHLQQIKEVFLDGITVTKRGGISSVK